MTYHVIGPDGNRYGPADLPTLNQWAAEGRVTPSTMLEDSSGARIAASSVPGLVFGPPRMSSPNEPYGSPGAGYGQGPQYPYGPQSRGDNGSGDVTAAWVLGSVGFCVCPIVISTIGIVMASRAKDKGHPSGQAAMIFCIVSLIVGMGLGVLLAVSKFNNPSTWR
jgi:hypothetical protein